MSADTPDQQITLPVGADLANVVAMMQSAIADIETRLGLRYASDADRTARHPVGVAGEISDLLAEARADSFDGTGWISRNARGLYGLKIRNTNLPAINNNAALAPDPVLAVPIGATGEYAFGGEIFYDCSAVADLALAFTWPGAPTQARWGGMGRNAVTQTNVEANVQTVSGTKLAFGGNGVGTLTWMQFFGFIKDPGVAGTLQLLEAQNTAEVSNLIIYSGSRLWILKTKP